MFKKAGSKNSNIKEKQFWQQHNNPDEAGFVTEPHYLKYSSAANYCGEDSLFEIDLLIW